MPRLDMKYSTHRGDSIYPIKTGNVFLLKKTRERYNRVLKLSMNHQVYLWILNVGKLKKGEPPMSRRCNIFTLYVPVDGNFKEKRIYQQSMVHFESICRNLSRGYELLGKVNFDYKDNDWKRFYKLIGLLQ